MKRLIPILALIAVGACVLPAGAQSKRIVDPVAEKRSTDSKKHAASLLEIAKKLLQAGNHDVAAQIESQARRLQGKSKAKAKPKSKRTRSRIKSKA